MCALASDQAPLTVSVVIPVHNAEAFLAAAVESALAQTVAPLEVIVVDDASTDGTPEIARRFGDAVSYMPQPRGGAAAARNRAIRQARGDLLAFLDADDVWEERKLELQIDALRRDPDLDIVFGHVGRSRDVEGDRQTWRATGSCADIVPGILPTTLLAPRQVFGRVGLFEETWRSGEFTDWYIRARDLGLKMAVLPNLVAWRRLHADNNWLRFPEARSDYVRVLKAALDRRRAATPPSDPSP